MKDPSTFSFDNLILARVRDSDVKERRKPAGACGCSTSHETSEPKPNGGEEGKRERTGLTAAKGRGELVVVCFPVGKAQIPMSPYVAPSPEDLSSRGPNDLILPQRGVTYRGRALVLAPDVRRHARPV